jgi:hypothetical protein
VKNTKDLEGSGRGMTEDLLNLPAGSEVNH